MKKKLHHYSNINHNKATTTTHMANKMEMKTTKKKMTMRVSVMEMLAIKVEEKKEDLKNKRKMFQKTKNV